MKKYNTESDFYSYWLKDINLYNTPEEEENLEMIRRYQNGDKEAFKELLVRNKRIILFFAKLFSSDRNVLGDLFQSGSIALEEAALTYNPERSAFSTYLGIVIKDHMINTLNENKIGYSLPKNLFRKIKSYKNLILDYRAQGKDIPNDEELQELLHVSSSKFKKIKAHELYNVASLQVICGEDAELQDYTGSDDENLNRVEDLSEQDILHYFKEQLTPIQYIIFYLQGKYLKMIQSNP